jgi:hypothetical protein
MLRGGLECEKRVATYMEPFDVFFYYLHCKLHSVNVNISNYNYQNKDKTMYQISDYIILIAALLSMIFSIYLWFSGEQEAGVYVGLWVPSIIGFGCYVKIAGSNKRRS